MKKLTPILTEKSLADAKRGKYTFAVDMGLTKNQIKRLVSEVFGVNVTKVRTSTKKGRKKKNFRGRIQVIKPSKKATVELSGKETIDLFEVKKK